MVGVHADGFLPVEVDYGQVAGKVSGLSFSRTHLAVDVSRRETVVPRQHHVKVYTGYAVHAEVGRYHLVERRHRGN